MSSSRGELVRRWVISGVLCTVAVAFGLFAYQSFAALKTEPKARKPVEKVYHVEVFDVTSTNVQEILTGFGTVRPDREVMISAEVSGRVLNMHPNLDVGEAVRTADVSVGEKGESKRHEGDLLVRIDPEAYVERVIQAENFVAADKVAIERLEQEERNNARTLAKAEADLKTFDKEFRRVEDLFKKGVASQSEVTRVRLEMEQYRDVIIRAENDAALFKTRREEILVRLQGHETDKNLAEIDLKRTEIRPPFSGRIAEVQVELGQFIRQGDPILKIIDLSVVEIAIPLTLAEYSRLGPQLQAGNQPLAALSENETDAARWHGTVRRVAPAADESTRTIDVFVSVDNSSQAVPLLPGTFVHARIDGPHLQEAILIPRDAITSGGVFVVEDGKARRRMVTVERTLHSMALISEGLKASDHLILTNLDVISDGALVTMQRHRTLAEEVEKLGMPLIRLEKKGQAERPLSESDRSARR